MQPKPITDNELTNTK